MKLKLVFTVLISVVTMMCCGKTSFNDLVAIIETNTGSGTGFIARDAEGLWLYTNEHVVRGGNPKATLLTGRKVEFTDMQIASDRDAVRFKVEGRYSAFAISSEIATVGDQIWVFGNSDGAGVATQAGGFVNGVGPVDVEVSADFVPGNSGSPIVKHGGDVLAMATYLLKGDGGKDWTKAGTRYSEVRRFGIRIDNVKWVPVKAKEYYNAAKQLKDVQTFVTVMEYACFPKPHEIASYDSKVVASVVSQSFSAQLRNVCSEDAKFIKSLDEQDQVVRAYDREVNNFTVYLPEGKKAAIRERHSKKLTSAKIATNRKYRASLMARDKALKEAIRSIKFRKMPVARMDVIYKSYADLLEAMRRDFIEDNKNELILAGHDGIYKPL